MSFTKIFEKFYNVLCVLVLFIAITVMVAWILQMPEVIQIAPQYPPMVFNSALSMAALALAILFSENRWGALSKWISAVPLGISGLTLLEYFSVLNLGIDTWFMKPFYEVGVSFPGRMAISTATCLFILSLISFFRSRRFEYKMGLVAGASIVLGFCAVNLLAFVLGFNSEFGWGSYSRMALHTSICLSLISLAYLSQLYISVRKNRVGQGQFVPFMVVIVGILTSVFIWQMLVLRDQDRNRKLIQIRLESLKSQLDNVFKPLESSLNHMAQHFSTGAYKSRESWLEDAELYFNEFSGMKRLLWSDQDNITRWVYPLDNGGANLLNVNVAMANEDLMARFKTLSTQNRTMPMLSKIFDLKTGGRGFVLLVPVFQGGKFFGIVSAAVLAEPFFQRAIHADGYDIWITEDGVDIFKKGQPDPVFAKDWTASTHYSSMDVDWVISIVPKAEVIRENTSALPGIVLIFGVGFSSLLGLALSFYNRSRVSEQKAQEAFKLKQASMNSVPLLMISMDKDAIIQEMNATAERILEYKNEEVAFKTSPAIFHDAKELREAHEKAEKELGHSIVMGPAFMDAYLELGYYKASEWTLISKTGKRYTMILSVSKIVDDKGEVTGYLKVYEDVTELKEKERVLKEQEQKILASSRLASLGEMAAGMAHEINNPLAIISGHLGILRRLMAQRGLAEDVEINKRLDSLDSVVQRIAKIIRGMRSYVRDSDIGEGEVVSVESLVDDTLAFCQEKFRSDGIEIELSIDSHLCIQVRPYQISQVLLNLLNNAHDAVLHSKVKKVQVAAHAANGGVELSVTDSGPGVPYHLRGKIMQPFFTTKEVGKGVGLGLSISQGIIAAHAGKFFLDESSAKTRFVIWLPEATDSKPIQLG